jgi:hypothetical protein
MSERPRRLPMREPLSRKRVLPSEPASAKRATTPTPGIYCLDQPPPAYPSLTIFSQAQQRREASIPVYSRRANPFWPNRMSQAAGFPSLCRQASGLPGHYAVARREPGSSDPRNKFLVQVLASRPLPTLRLPADTFPVISSIPTSTSSASPFALSATSPQSKCRAICSQTSKPSFPAPTPTFDEKLPFAP